MPSLPLVDVAGKPDGTLREEGGGGCPPPETVSTTLRLTCRIHLALDDRNNGNAHGANAVRVRAAGSDYVRSSEWTGCEDSRVGADALNGILGACSQPCATLDLAPIAESGGELLCTSNGKSNRGRGKGDRWVGGAGRYD